MRKVFSLLLMLFLYTAVAAQQYTPEQYIAQYKDLAISEMKRTGVPASIKLAQGLLETEYGNSDLVKRSNNHFGIKCKSNWTGEFVTHDDDARGECFRKYASAEDSYKDHSNFLKNSARYASLFKLDKADYKGWAYGLKAAGYATNPQYPSILIRNIEKYNLQQYDTEDGADELIDQQQVVIKKGVPPVVIAPTPTPAQVPVEEKKEQIPVFNGLKAIFAEKGSSLLAIATNYKIQVAKLLEYNDLKTDGLLQEAQYIYLEPKMKEGNEDFYITKRRETLYAIAQSTGVRLKELATINNLSEDIYVPLGKKIFLRKGAAPTAQN